MLNINEGDLIEVTDGFMAICSHEIENNTLSGSFDVNPVNEGTKAICVAKQNLFTCIFYNIDEKYYYMYVILQSIDGETNKIRKI